MMTRLTDNALTCDSEGNCMLKDNLICWSTSCKDKKAKAAAIKAEIEAAAAQQAISPSIKD